MTAYLRQRELTLTSLVLVVWFAAAAVGQEPAWNPKAAAKYLDERGEWWLGWGSSARGQGTSCISCHTALPVALARPALAKQLGETEPAAVEKKLIANVQKRVANWERISADQ